MLPFFYSLKLYLITGRLINNLTWMQIGSFSASLSPRLSGITLPLSGRQVVQSTSRETVVACPLEGLVRQCLDKDAEPE